MTHADMPRFAGATLPPLDLPPIDLATLQGYAKASGDYAPIHLDAAAARAAGFPNVIAHGLLVMAYLGRAVRSWYPDAELREFNCRFMAPTLMGDRLSCSGRITIRPADSADRLLHLDIGVADQTGEIKLKGAAQLALRARE